MLQIVEEDPAGVWLGLYPVEERVNSIKDYFDLPYNIIPFSGIALGYSEKSNNFIDRYYIIKVKYNQYKEEENK